MGTRTARPTLRVNAQPNRDSEQVIHVKQRSQRNRVPDHYTHPACLPRVNRMGDLWSCGEHRVLCGDATSAEAVVRLGAAQLGRAPAGAVTPLPLSFDVLLPRTECRSLLPKEGEPTPASARYLAGNRTARSRRGREFHSCG
jgi:hypothetical protein